MPGYTGEIRNLVFGDFPDGSDVLATLSRIKKRLSAIQWTIKIISINNRDLLEALDKLISSSSSESDVVELTKEQKIMLKMSERDIKSGNLISREAMDKRNLEWLNAM